MDKRTLRKEVAAEFKVKAKHPWKFSWKHMDRIDFETMTLRQAKAYYAAGVPGLIKTTKKE